MCCLLSTPGWFAGGCHTWRWVVVPDSLHTAVIYLSVLSWRGRDLIKVLKILSNLANISKILYLILLCENVTFCKAYSRIIFPCNTLPCDKYTLNVLHVRSLIPCLYKNQIVRRQNCIISGGCIDKIIWMYDRKLPSLASFTKYFA